MASTNKTTHYDLSQYVSGDKPTYLSDYNGDMAKIDTGINAAKTVADSASTAAGNAQTAAETAQTTANTAVTNAATAQSKADSNETNIGTLANLNTTVKSNLVGAINEVNTAATTSEVVNSLNGSETDKAPSVNAVKTELAELSEVILYNNTSGTQGTVNLSDSAANYEHIDIIYKDINNHYNSVSGFSGNNVTTFGIYSNGTDDLFLRFNQKSIGTTTITNGLCIECNVAGSATPVVNSSNSNYIVKVIGYKK